MMKDQKRSPTDNNVSVDQGSQIEIMRQFVEEAEAWSDLLLRYSKSMIFYFLPATALAWGIFAAQLFLTVVVWRDFSEHVRLANVMIVILLAATAVLAVGKEVEALLRYGANKRRHREWHKKFETLREVERQLEEVLLTSREPSAPE